MNSEGVQTSSSETLANTRPKAVLLKSGLMQAVKFKIKGPLMFQGLCFTPL